jgi:DNA polymerase-3 subunit alpha
VESSDAVLGDAARNARERETGQVSLFGEASADASDLRLAAVDDWLAHERLGEEFSAIGFYLSGHPLDNYRTALTRLQALTHGQVLDDRRSNFVVSVAGTLIRKSERRGRNDQNYAFVSFSDPTGMFEVMFFPEVLAASRPLLEAGKSILLKLNATWEGDELKLRAIAASDLDKAAADAGEGLKIFLEDTRSLSAIASQLRTPGKGMITLVIPASEGREVEIKLPQRQMVNPALKGAIKSMPGVAMVEAV